MRWIYESLHRGETVADSFAVAELRKVTLTEGDDQYGAGDEGEHIYALRGNDSVGGGNGDDVIIGGAGNDWLNGVEGTTSFTEAVAMIY